MKHGVKMQPSNNNYKLNKILSRLLFRLLSR